MATRGILYLDSSIIVSLATYDPLRAKEAWTKVHGYSELITSELSVVECQAGIASQIAESRKPEFTAPVEQNLNRLLAGMSILSISSLTLGSARALVKKYRVSIGLRTLDAIHLATANMLQQALMIDHEDLEFHYLTADRRQHEAFSSEGLIGTCLA